jgi:predicted RNA-binding protein with PIN domain
MPYLIDGHNLIPNVGLHLDSLDDELELIRLLQEFCRLSRSQAEVYFDNAPAGQPTKRKHGLVAAHFVRKPDIADDVIIQRIRKLGASAKNWTVISSDRRVQAEARAARAKVISSDEFSRQVRLTLQNKSASSGDNAMDEKEINDWLELFGKRR